MEKWVQVKVQLAPAMEQWKWFGAVVSALLALAATALEQRGVVFVPLVWRKFISALGQRALL
jgi:hypothetical protein